MAGLGAGCSGEAVTAPEPTLRTPGTFVVARPSREQPWTLQRILAPLALSDGRTMLITVVYGVQPRDREEARSLARRHDLPTTGSTRYVLESQFMAQEWSIVWYRTLTDDEHRYR